MKKVKLIYNPSSGETAVASCLDQIIEIYQSYGYTLSMYRLDFKGSEQDVVFGLKDQDYHHILIAGGDGTVNYIVNLLMTNKITTPISIIPTGTANDFASMLGISNDVEKACHKILKGTFRDIDLGVVNGKYFVNVFSCGLFTDVSQRTPTILKNTFGNLAYYVGGLGEIPSFRKMTIKIESNGGNYEGSCLIFFVFNGKTAGKIKIAKGAKIDDGLLDVLIFKGDNPLETIQTIFHYTSILPKRHMYPSGVVHIQCSKLYAECLRDEHTDIDGQAGPRFPLQVECIHGAIKILCPE